MKSYILGFECVKCKKIYDYDDQLMICPTCSNDEGILDILFDYDALKMVINKKILSENKNFTMWRYASLIGIDDEGKDMLNIGFTPLVKSKHLANHLKVKTLYIKDDTQNPSNSLKDRASGVAVLKAKSLNYDTVSCSSTGNAASSLACHAARMGLRSVIFIPKRAPIGKITQLLVYGAILILVDGDYQETYQLSKKAILYHGWYNRNAAVNPFLVEGKKTVALEICEQLDFKITDWVVISVGDGCSIAGVYKGFYDFYQLGLIKSIPKILGVQSMGCSPIYKAFINNHDLIIEKEMTIADSISVGHPRNFIKALNAVKKTNGTFIEVSDDDILDSIRLLGSKEGIFGEPAGVASLAGYQKALKEKLISHDASVTIIVTGHGLKDIENAKIKLMQPVLLKPDLDILNTYLKKLEGE